MNRSTIAILRITIRLLTLADSSMPITRMYVASSTMTIAGRLNSEPVGFQPGWVQAVTALATSAALQKRSGAEVIAAGQVDAEVRRAGSRSSRDQPTPTVAAPMAYSSTRSQPMIQATNSPIVA